jgi:hypothetical protein
MPIVIYRRPSFYVALGVDAAILSKLLSVKLHVAHEGKTVAYYVSFKFDGSEADLSQLMESLGFKVVFK